MTDVTERSFGLLIAFLLPGFLALWGYSLLNDSIAKWMTFYSSEAAPTVGGFLFSTLASLAVGLLISVIRIATIDKFFYRVTRLKRATPNYVGLGELGKLAGFQAAVDQNYRYYQSYTHSWIAGIILFIVSIRSHPDWNFWYTLPLVLILSVAVLWVARGELKSFNERISKVMN